MSPVDARPAIPPLERRSRVLHRTLRGEPPPVAVGGHGVRLTDADGHEVLDACGGAAVSALGHRHPRVIEAIHQQADRHACAHTGFFSSEPAEALADALVGDEPGGLAYAYLAHVSSTSFYRDRRAEGSEEAFPRVGAGRRLPRHPGHRQGARPGGLSVDRGGARVGPRGGVDPGRLRRVPARAHLSRPADRLRGDHILLAPPYIVTPEEIDLVVERLGDALDEALDAIG